MFRLTSTPRYSSNWNRVLRLLAFALIVPLLLVAASTGPSLQTVPRIQPMLLQIAAENPKAILDVIVQKTATDHRVEQMVQAVGGEVTLDLAIINAFAAHLPASALAKLAACDGVRWISLDGPVVKTEGPDGPLNTWALHNVYDRVIGADKVWAEGYQGSGITVAVVDSGWVNKDDFRATPEGGAMRLLTRVGFNGNQNNLDDHYGHGVHVAGIIGGNGRKSGGKYIGIAPRVNFISVKFADHEGQGTTAAVVACLQWIYEHRAEYKIRVVNLSLNGAVPEPYSTSPLDAAVEILWLNRIVVVASSGNSGTSGVVYPPGNDPFVITVGATEDQGTVGIWDDHVARFSAFGRTESGFAKPDFVAPGENIVAPLASVGATLAKEHPSNIVGNSDYFRMSGTSMSAAITTGSVALLLQREPNLTPDQVKFRLQVTANRNWPGYSKQTAGAGYLNIYTAMHNRTVGTANTGLALSKLLFTGTSPVNWTSANWNSANWNSANWNSANWNSANWNSANWNSTYWGP